MANFTIRLLVAHGDLTSPDRTGAVTAPEATFCRGFPFPAGTPQVSILLGTHDNCRAMSIGQDLSADRPEEHSGEAAVTSVTDN